MSYEDYSRLDHTRDVIDRIGRGEELIDLDLPMKSFDSHMMVAIESGRKVAFRLWVQMRCDATTDLLRRFDRAHKVCIARTGLNIKLSKKGLR
jgi:hypothetical protein